MAQDVDRGKFLEMMQQTDFHRVMLIFAKDKQVAERYNNQTENTDSSDDSGDYNIRKQQVMEIPDAGTDESGEGTDETADNTEDAFKYR